MPAEVTDGPRIGLASESFRRTNPREAASGLVVYGDFVEAAASARNDFSCIAERGTLPVIAI